MIPHFSNLLSRPLAISEAGAKHLRSLAINQANQAQFALALNKIDPKSGCFEYDYLGNEIQEPEDLCDGVRMIPLYGPITRGLGRMGQYFGMADTDRFSKWINEATADNTVSTIALHIKSPGGDAIGCFEAAQLVKDASKVKPVIVFCDDMMASAAYFIGAGATAIFASPSSLIGSVGTYVLLTDDSEAWKKMGVEFIVVRSGKYKGSGLDGYSQEQIDNIQKMVDSFGAQFRGFVSANRPSIQESDMEGQVFLGGEASQNGFVDGIANSLMYSLDEYKRVSQVAMYKF